MRRAKPKLEATQRARPEVVVIGSGAVGAACASALARAGHRVRVLSDPTRSTTALSGGHLLLQSKKPGPSLDLARRSLELLSEFVVGREEALAYRQTGSLVLAVTSEDAERLRARYEALAAAGVPLEWLSGDAVRNLEPGCSHSVAAGSYCALDAQVHPGALAAAWLQDALRHGATIKSGARVEAFVKQGGAISGVIAGRMEYAASAVVLAAGPWSAELAQKAGATIEIRPRRGLLLRAHSGPILASRPLLGAEYLDAKFGEREREVAFNFQQHPDGECVLGGTRDFTESEDAGVPEEILACADRYLPGVRELEWTAQPPAFRPWTPTGQPYIGPCEIPGLYLACGHEGDGITLAAATAERIAACLR